jgi:hypothetical protein
MTLVFVSSSVLIHTLSHTQMFILSLYLYLYSFRAGFESSIQRVKIEAGLDIGRYAFN